VILNNGTYRAANKFDTVIPGANDVLVKYAYYGDADLSGHVDGSDYSLIDNTFNQQSVAGYAVQIASETSEIASGSTATEPGCRLRSLIATAMLRPMVVGNQRRRILVITPTNMGCYRELVQGISLYGNTQGRWHLEICPPTHDFIKVIQSSATDGLLLGAIVEQDKVCRAVKMVPASVAVCRGYIDDELPLPAVESDDVAVGKIGAEHLLAKGFKHFAFVGQDDATWSELRRKGFEETVRAAGHPVASYAIVWGTTVGKPVPVNPLHGPLNLWLEKQSKPLGVMAANDNMARIITRFCIDMGLRVPEDVAVLGVDNDDMSTAISNPPLSSVIIPWRAMGRTASALLDRLIDGEAVSTEARLLAPTGVAERQSTETVAISDEEVRTAICFIREHSVRRISVSQVVAEVGATRRDLETKFRNTLDRTILQEIRRCRVERARMLLSQTDLAISQIAAQSGFASVTWFTTAFRDLTGSSPAAYRQRVQAQ
jgi:LacI family transcriptional regulator